MNTSGVDRTSNNIKAKVTYAPTGMLHRVLSGEDYALALTPGFFRFYAHIGVLKALEETGCLRPSAVAGSSAGALVGGFLASGISVGFGVEQPNIHHLSLAQFPNRHDSR